MSVPFVLSSFAVCLERSVWPSQRGVRGLERQDDVLAELQVERGAQVGRGAVDRPGVIEPDGAMDAAAIDPMGAIVAAGDCADTPTAEYHEQAPGQRRDESGLHVRLLCCRTRLSEAKDATPCPSRWSWPWMNHRLGDARQAQARQGVPRRWNLPRCRSHISVRRTMRSATRQGRD